MDVPTLVGSELVSMHSGYYQRDAMYSVCLDGGVARWVVDLKLVGLAHRHTYALPAAELTTHDSRVFCVAARAERLSKPRPPSTTTSTQKSWRRLLARHKIRIYFVAASFNATQGSRCERLESVLSAPRQIVHGKSHLLEC